MITIDQALAAMRDANPLVDDSDLPESARSAAALLVDVERRTDVKTHEITRPAQLRRVARRRGPLVAVATATAILAAGVVFVLASLTGSSAPPADLEVAMDFFALYDAGDVSGYEALIDPVATWGPEDEPEEGFGFKSGSFFDSQYIRDSNARASYYIDVTGAAAITTCSPAGRQIRCEREISSGLDPGAVSRTSYLLTVSEGLIVDGTWSGDAPPPDADQIGLSAYRLWLMENRPGEFEQLFEGGALIYLNTAKARASHEQYVAEFLAETGGA